MTVPTAILVAGMHRSGTSALAGALNLLGVPLGQHLLEPGPDNPKGYWEHRDIVVVHDRLLAALGARWDDVRALPADWLASEAASRAAAAIGELVTRDFAGTPLWAVKDPRICRFLPLWFQVLRQQGIRPVVLFMARDPGEVAASIAARNHWRAPIGEMLWLRYVTEAATASRDEPRAVVVYNDLLDAPLAAVSRALAELHVDFDPATAGARDGLAGFIDKADRHHHLDRPGRLAERFAAIAQAAYDALRSVAHGDDAWAQVDKATAEFGKYWQHHGSAMDALAEMGVRLASGAESEWIENRRLASQLEAQLKWSEQAVRKQESLQAESATLQSKLTAQIDWSEQAQKRIDALQASHAEVKSKLAAQEQWSVQAVQAQELLQAEKAALQSRLTAQVQWSEQAVRKHEGLQAENADLRSKLAAQIHWSEQAQQHIEALQSGYADVQSKLAAQIQAVDRATQQRDALAAELAQTGDRLAEETRSLSVTLARFNASEAARDQEIAEHRRAMDEAERVRSALATRLAAGQRESERLAGDVATFQQRQAELEAELRAVYASRSWRLTQPIRRVAGLFGRKASPDGNNKRDAE